jgi:molybdate-binding protein
LHDAVLIALWRREQGVLVPPGNPLKLGSIEDISRTRARIAVRPKGAGAQLLLLALLHRANTSFDQLTVATPLCPIGPDIAQAIRVGRADTGIATRGVAASAGLDFVPITWESFDLVMRQHDYFKPSMQTLFNFLRSEEFATRAAEFGGYDVSVAGTVRFVS